MTRLRNKNTISQCEMILHHLMMGNSLTHRQAEQLFDCDRLSARIYDLKQQGHVINSEMVTSTLNSKRHARYSIKHRQ